MKHLEIPKHKLNEWNELENSNAHGKRLERIADYIDFYCDDLENRHNLNCARSMLNTLNARHYAQGYITEWEIQMREMMRQEIRAIIADEFGQTTLLEINP